MFLLGLDKTFDKRFFTNLGIILTTKHKLVVSFLSLLTSKLNLRVAQSVFGTTEPIGKNMFEVLTGLT